MDQHTDKKQEEASGVERELLNLQSTNKPGLSELTANITNERKKPKHDIDPKSLRGIKQ